MRVLYVVGTCLSKNTSANMSHNGYVQGLLENGCQVDILMAKDGWGQTDVLLPRWKNVRYFCYSSEAIHDKLRKIFGKSLLRSSGCTLKGSPDAVNETACGKKRDIKGKMRTILKKAYYTMFPSDPRYPLEKQWLKRASHFRSNIEYDLVISNSSPSASHKLVSILKSEGHLKYKRWIQIWEDPWYFDLYGGHNPEILDEEKDLLRTASEIFYVSPLTLIYQQRFFKDCAEKMRQIPLPYLLFAPESKQACNEISFAYLGDYYSHVRNLLPFYQALRQVEVRAYIYGDSDIHMEETALIEISGRVTLDKLAKVQEKSAVLVHLCNLRGGQIPGKIYHYSATSKPILFILDGTPEEQTYIKKYFEAFERYYFCNNDVKDITVAMKRIITDVLEGKKWSPVTAFAPKKVVVQLL